MTESLSLQTPRAIPFKIEHNCTASIVSCLIACEEKNTFLKVVAYAAAFFVTLALAVSVVGIIPLLMCVAEYKAQTLEDRLGKAPNPDAERIRTLETEKNADADRIRALEGEKSEIDTRVVSLENQLREATEAAKQARLSLAEHEEQLKKRAADFSERSQEAQQLIGKLGKAREKAAAAESELGRTQLELQTAHSSFSALQAQCTALQSQSSLLTEQNAGQLQRIHEIETNLREEQERSDQALKAIRAELLQATSQRDEAETELTALREKLAATESDAQNLISKLEAETEAHSRLKEESTTTILTLSENQTLLFIAQQQKEEAVTRVAELEAALASAEAGVKERIEALQDQLQKAHAERDTALADKSSLENRLEALRKELAEERANLKKVSDERSQAVEKSLRLEAIFREHNKQVDAWNEAQKKTAAHIKQMGDDFLATATTTLQRWERPAERKNGGAGTTTVISEPSAHKAPALEKPSQSQTESAPPSQVDLADLTEKHYQKIVARVNEELEASKKEYEAALALVEEARKRTAEAETREHTLHQKAQQLSAEISGLQDKLRILQETSNEKLFESSEKIRDLTEQLTESMYKCADLEQQVAIAQNMTDTLQSQLSDTRRELFTADRGAKASIKDHLSEIARLNHRLEEVVDENGRRMKEASSEAQAIQDRLEERNRSLREELSKERERAAQLAAQLNDTQNEIRKSATKQKSILKAQQVFVHNVMKSPEGRKLMRPFLEGAAGAGGAGKASHHSAAPSNDVAEELRRTKHALAEATQLNRQLQNRLTLEKVSPKKVSPSGREAQAGPPELHTPVKGFSLLDSIPEQRAKAREREKELLGSPTRPAPQAVPPFAATLGAGAGDPQLATPARSFTLGKRPSPPMPVLNGFSSTAQQAMNLRADMHKSVFAGAARGGKEKENREQG